MNKHNLYFKSEEELILEKGIYGDNIFIYLRDKYFYISENHIRCFKFSLRRAKTTLNISYNESLYKIFIKYIKTIKLEKINENLFYLIILYPVLGIKNLIIPQKIKLKEINEYLALLNTDSPDIIIKKQNEKLLSLLSKIDEFEKKFKEPTTDEEFIFPLN
jgi:hypothetical protein